MNPELMKQIIEILQTHGKDEDHSYCDTGEDMEFYCRSECVEMAIRRLKAEFNHG